MAGIGATVAFLLASPQFAAADDTTTIKGMITAREGNHITVTGQDGTKTVVVLTDQTRVVEVAGALKLQRNDKQASDLINGLPVDVDISQNGQETDAVRFTFKEKDLKTAQQVAAGTAQVKEQARAKVESLQAQNDELRNRMANANQYVEKARATVYFNTGSSALSSQGKSDLKDVAAKAQGIKGYFIGIVGYADPRGNADANQRLSERRAAAVTQYLQKYCGVMPSRVLSPDAMGDAQQVGDNSSASGLAQNRRVVVKVLTNKGLEGL
jgi:outer membrane protein OmpA-like peptidoglycan-associated protein